MTKVLLSIDEKLLARIDREARGRKMSRSAYLAEVAKEDLGEAVGPGANPQVRQTIRTIKALFANNPTPGDPTQLIREDRDSH